MKLAARGEERTCLASHGGNSSWMLPDFWGANFHFQNFSKNSEKNHERI
jgi:hypothetical protein